MRKLTAEEIERINRTTHEKAAADFKEFRGALDRGECWICKAPLSSFDEENPCMHWLLMPSGFRKKHFVKVYQNFSMDRTQAFLRWLANATTPFRDINDVAEDHGGDKPVAVTIKHKNLEWAFSASAQCVAGKEGGHPPHYHFQMRIDGKPFIDYGEYHIPLTDYDLWVLDVQQGKIPQIRHAGLHGMGIGGAAEHIDPEDLLNGMRVMDDMDSATFHIGTMVEAEPGSMISGDDLADLIRESQETGIPLAKLVHKLKNVHTQVIIEPGDGAAKAAPRTPRKRKKSR